MQNRAQCWEELSPCPHATQGGRFLLRLLHVSGTAKDPRTELVIDRQWDVSGMPTSLRYEGSRIYVVVMATFFAGWGEVKSQWVEASANSTQLARLFSLQGSCHTEPEAFVIIFVHCQRNIAKRATPWTANLGTVARLVSHFHDTPPGNNCKFTRDSRYCGACSWMV